MPADQPAMFPRCDCVTELDDNEIAAVVRGVAVGGVAGPLDMLQTSADCALEERHPGDCAGLVGELSGEPGKAWLRWGDERRIDWLAECARKDCDLYRGHPGECNPDILEGL
jgi:hypothetical protein